LLHIFIHNLLPLSHLKQVNPTSKNYMAIALYLSSSSDLDNSLGKGHSFVVPRGSELNDCIFPAIAPTRSELNKFSVKHRSYS